MHVGCKRWTIDMFWLSGPNCGGADDFYVSQDKNQNIVSWTPPLLPGGHPNLLSTWPARAPWPASPLVAHGQLKQEAISGANIWPPLELAASDRGLRSSSKPLTTLQTVLGVCGYPGRQTSNAKCTLALIPWDSVVFVPDSFTKYSPSTVMENSQCKACGLGCLPMWDK